MTNAKPRTGGQILIDQLRIHGVQHAFCVPGESYLAALDALHDAPIQLTICRQEGGATMMAEAQGKLTGRPGICFVTRGPGATNASPGIHIAKQDSSPLILFVGQVARDMRDREAFQEVDYRAVFGTLAKWATEIDQAARIPEIVARAFHVATSGRPGPVVIGLPEDVLTEEALVADARPVGVIDPAPSPADIERFAALLGEARRPLVIAGGSRWSQEAVDGLVRFAETFELPVAVTFRRQALFPQAHPNYAGDLGLGANPKLLDLARESDLVILLGTRLSEIASQSFTLLQIPAPTQKLVHVHPGIEELGRVYQADLPVNASPKAFIAALAGLRPGKAPGRAGRMEEAHRSYLGWSDKPAKQPGRFNLGEVIAELRDRLPPDAIVTNGAGNYASWLHRYYRFRRFGTQLAPTSGSMGYGVPAAVGAARLLPRRTIVAFAGDGCFLMNGQEFATAVQYELPIVVVVVDNGMYGTIRMHQENTYPGRVVGTTLKNPDFAAYAVAFGGHGERIERTEDFMPAFERAIASGKPAILHCIVDPEALTPAKSLSELRQAALAKH